MKWIMFAAGLLLAAFSAAEALSGGVTLYVTNVQATSTTWMDCVGFFGGPCSFIYHWEGNHQIADTADNSTLGNEPFSLDSDRGFQRTMTATPDLGHCYRAHMGVTRSWGGGFSEYFAFHSGEYCAPPPPDNPPPDESQCYEYCSPVLVDLDGGGFRLTGVDDPVLFDIDADGVVDRITWTAAGSQTALLGIDGNSNGAIDDGSELFGDRALLGSGRPGNGYDALAEYDRPAMGGNGDGIIDPADMVWSRLRLWLDTNHNGASEPGELIALDRAHILALGYDYIVSRRQDRYGNIFRFKGEAWCGDSSGHPKVVPTYDVYFQRVP